MLPATVEAFAPAKVNLTLHVTGRRADGYHLLDSLVVFAGLGDWLSVHAAATPSLKVQGPFAADIPDGPDNLVWRAATLAAPQDPVRLCLTKCLPAASGLGGGSADAAAVLRALAVLGLARWPVPEDALVLGADVPVCLSPGPQRMAGIGEDLTALAPLPPVWLLLANPGHATPTGAVFAALERRDNPAMPTLPARWKTPGELVTWLAGQRNDLEAPARRLVPQIDTVLSALAAQPGCALARMSGSGATCFGLFVDAPAAAAAQERLRAAQPHWWCEAAPVLGPRLGTDQVRRATT